MESIVYLDHIKCNGCVRSINEKLTPIEGVSGVEVDIPTGKVSIQHEDKVELDQLLEILDDAGYPEK